MTSKEYLLELKKYNKWMILTLIGLCISFILYLSTAIFTGISSSGHNPPNALSITLLILFMMCGFSNFSLGITYIVLAVFQIISAFKVSEKENSIYKVFSILSIVGLPIVSPIVIFFLIRSDLKVLNHQK